MLDDRNLRFDLFALGLLAFTIFMGLSLLTYSPADPLGDPVYPLNRIYEAHQVTYPLNDEVQNVCGHAGAMCADMALRMFGLGAYYVLACVLAADVWLLMRRPLDGAGTRLIGWLLSLVGGVTLLQMFAEGLSVGPVIGPGGYLGAMGRVFLESNFAAIGSLILLATVIISGVMLCTDYVLLRVGVVATTALINTIPRGRLPFGARSLITKADDLDHELEDEFSAENSDEHLYDEDSENFMTSRGRVFSELDRQLDAADTEEEPSGEAYDEEWDDGEFVEDEEEFVEADAEEEVEEEEEEDEEESTARGQRDSKSAKAAKHEARAEVMAQLEEASREQDPQDYELPPMNLLNKSKKFNVEQLTKEVRRKATMLEKTFEDFNLEVKVVDIETGPVIAQYEVALKRGLRLSKITGLADDLAIALRVPSVRIVAPIPGKNTVGIEVPNDDRQVVRMREVMDETNGHVRKMSIPIFLGKDVSGNPLAVDLAKLPHLLIAGRTGTGKSVCLNSIISSMLMTKTPDDVRLLMIDPKMVELSGYSRLPHLMHPVVTDMRKAEAILAWACEKMDERYQLLARAGVRHIESYNQLGEEELLERLSPETEDEREAIPRHLPFIVIVADEMADLMMTAGKEVEAHIIRLAAKSRAVGIHLILATQKPTVDVITGLIKSNLPARIAFQVASKQDSRVVLDENGADKLLGYGDMLLLSPGTSTLLRGQGTFMSDEEIDRIVDYCGNNAEQNFVRELVQLKVEEPEASDSAPLKKRDDLYEEAIGIVVREGRGSVSLLQRNLQIGYGRAARLIDFMAEDGIVGAYNGSQAREVLMTIADWESSRSATTDTSDVESGSPAAAASPDLPALSNASVADEPDAATEDEQEYDELEDDEVDDETSLAPEADEEEYEYEYEYEEAEGDDEAVDEADEYEEEDEYEEGDEGEELEEDDAEEPDGTGVELHVAPRDAAKVEENLVESEDWEANYEGDAYDPVDYDDEEHQAAVADGPSAEDVSDVEGIVGDEELEYEDVEDAEEIADRRQPPRPKSRRRKSKGTLHRSHAD